MKELTPAELTEWKRIVTDILREFHGICREHGLRYFACGGTAIGAVRHQGIIPWDDDIDVSMPRPDYDRFIALCSSRDMGNYELATPRNTENYPLPFVKLCRKDTTLIEESDTPCILGVFIDIFPLDGTSTDINEAAALKKKYNRLWNKLEAISTRNTFAEYISLLKTPHEWGRFAVKTAGFFFRPQLRNILLKSIGDYAFSMTALKTIDIPNSVVKIGANAFDQCRVLESINIPESVEEIGEYALNGCWSLSSLTIPSNITSIEDGTFRECEKLETISIPEKVTHIGNFAFRNCKSLVRLTIPGNVESTGEFVFRFCDRLTDITCLATNPPTAKDFGFQYGMMKTPTLHVLPGCKEAYENAMYWQDLTIVDDAVAPTGINAASAMTKDAKIFSISGQRLPAPQKGINVVNGRKVMY